MQAQAPLGTVERPVPCRLRGSRYVGSAHVTAGAGRARPPRSGLSAARAPRGAAPAHAPQAPGPQAPNRLRRRRRRLPRLAAPLRQRSGRPARRRRRRETKAATPLQADRGPDRPDTSAATPAGGTASAPKTKTLRLDRQAASLGHDPITGAERVPAVDATDVGHGGAPRCSAVSAINGAAGAEALTKPWAAVQRRLMSRSRFNTLQSSLRSIRRLRISPGYTLSPE